MNERIAEAEAIFFAVIDAPAEAQERILAERCAGDAELRALVERLLAHDREGAGSLLDPPTRTAASTPGSVDALPAIGPYRIVSMLAEGGMGTVYLARQTAPMERDVALKVIRVGLDSKEIVARFEAERQALALMDHPNIARVLDAGQTGNGLPYFVMELIRGLPITEYCDKRNLGIPDRLELFRRVCDAVQHAHQKAVIHRDLKPSNVLVAEIDGKPVPKVIDFGVAKAVGRRLTGRTMHTGPGVLLGTLEYMSPEHADPDNLDLDTRADVYSLGVILYELLVGSRPFEGEGTLSLIRRIREEEPKRPSTRVAPREPGSAERARARGTDATALRGLLRRDLDWVVIRALEKDRGRRYPSPADLSEDLGRYLRDEAVTARPPTMSYRTRKFVRRHRLGVAAGAVVLVSLIGAVMGTSVGLVRARSAEARARAERDRSQKAAEFLASTLQGLGSAEMAYDLAATLRGRGRQPGASALEDPTFGGVNLIDAVRSVVDKRVLDKAVGRIERELKGEPALASDLYGAIGNAYGTEGSALPCKRQAVLLSENARGPADPATLDLRLSLANSCLATGQYQEGETECRRVLEISRSTFGEDAQLAIRAMIFLGRCYQQRSQAWVGSNDPARRPPRAEWSDSAVSALRQGVENSRRMLGENDRLTLGGSDVLALALRDVGRYDEAEELIRRTLARSRTVDGASASATLSMELTYLSILYYSGRVEEAAQEAVKLQERTRRVFGENNMIALVIGVKLGEVYLDSGRHEEAEPLLRDAADRLRRTQGDENQFTREALNALTRLERLKQERVPGAAPSNP